MGQVVEDDAQVVFQIVGGHVGGPADDDVAVGIDEVGLVGVPDVGGGTGVIVRGVVGGAERVSDPDANEEDRQALTLRSSMVQPSS